MHLFTLLCYLPMARKGRNVLQYIYRIVIHTIVVTDVHTQYDA
jgi:hypothetical protein